MRQERRIGKRAIQKRAWDRAQGGNCIQCGAVVGARSVKTTGLCLRCATAKRPRELNGRFKK